MTLDLITKIATKCLMGRIHSMDTLDKGVIHVPGRTEQDSVRVHYPTQNSTQFETY